ncbi:Ribosomal protein S19, mitochondrial [Capsicum annuum]|uniref:Ribosomal protein S19, mitochondrial n=1 Tax=Capsicum annuum TaxID=4072 RepID=A0A2G2Y0J9_CAPAN|nr:Ribosomal protein S19, mitochondrial [Capsicum annuum]
MHSMDSTMNREQAKTCSGTQLCAEQGVGKSLRRSENTSFTEPQSKSRFPSELEEAYIKKFFTVYFAGLESSFLSLTGLVATWATFDSEGRFKVLKLEVLCCSSALWHDRIVPVTSVSVVSFTLGSSQLSKCHSLECGTCLTAEIFPRTKEDPIRQEKEEEEDLALGAESKRRNPFMPRRSIWKGSFVDAFLLRMKKKRDLLFNRKIWSLRSSMRQRRALRQFTLSTGKSAGRNSLGRIMVFHREGGSKRLQ